MSGFASKEWQEKIQAAMLAAIAEAERDLSPEQRKKNQDDRDRINAESRRAAEVGNEIAALITAKDYAGAQKLAKANGLDATEAIEDAQMAEPFEGIEL